MRHFLPDQVLFCPNGDVQETGAANFILIDGDEIITKDLDGSFLHGVTRDSILTLARDRDTVSERPLSVEELIERAQKPQTEAACQARRGTDPGRFTGLSRTHH